MYNTPIPAISKRLVAAAAGVDLVPFEFVFEGVKLYFIIQNMANEIILMSKDDLCSYLERQDLEKEAVDTIRSNRISGAAFLELTPEHLKELFPVVGDRISVNKILQKVKAPCHHGKNSVVSTRGNFS